LACGDIVGDPPGNLLPASGLPSLERPQVPAVAPADREVDIAGGVGDRFQMKGAVMEQVAEARPEELRLRMRGGAQLGEFLRGIFDLQDLDDFRGGFARGRTIILRLEVEDDDVLAA